MSLFDAVKSCFNKYATFQGRAPRSEYWWFWLFGGVSLPIICCAFFFIGFLFSNVAVAFITGGIAGFIWFIILFVPTVSVFVRRMHDTNHSGWFFWLPFIPIIFLLTGSDEENQYGLPVY